MAKLEKNPRVTVVVPSYNQGEFLDAALTSIYEQNQPVEVFVLDNCSTDNTKQVIQEWSQRLAGWRSRKDEGQAAAINEGVQLGSAPYVCWLNSDDLLLPGCLEKLILALERSPDAPAAYGRAWNLDDKSQKRTAVWVEQFDVERLSVRCIISQPATLMRRTAWEKIAGLNEKLHMAMDYDLWWRLYKEFGPLVFVDDYLAVNRVHKFTKTQSFRRAHYLEAMAVVKKHYGKVPLKWWLAQPYAVWLKSIIRRFQT